MKGSTSSRMLPYQEGLIDFRESVGSSTTNSSPTLPSAYLLADSCSCCSRWGQNLRKNGINLALTGPSTVSSSSKPKPLSRDFLMEERLSESSSTEDVLCLIPNDCRDLDIPTSAPAAPAIVHQAKVWPPLLFSQFLCLYSEPRVNTSWVGSLCSVLCCRNEMQCWCYCDSCPISWWFYSTNKKIKRVSISKTSQKLTKLLFLVEIFF